MNGNADRAEHRFWVVRLGEGGKYIDVGLDGSLAAIGWEELGDLAWLTDADENPVRLYRRLTDLYRRTYGGSNIAVGQSASQIWNFVREIAPCDTILLPDPRHKTVLPGTVVSGYRYTPVPNDGCPYPHRREVTWHKDKEFQRDRLSQTLRYAMGSLLTVFSLDRHAEELAGLVGAGPKEATGKDLVRLLIDRIYDSFSPQAFEEFVTDVLSTAGFQATATQYVADKGTDVIGILNAEGITQVTLRVQVKRGKSHVGIQEVLKIRGTLEVDSQGAIVSLGGFTKQAKDEAVSGQKKTVALIDGEALVDLLLGHWSELEPKHGATLRIRRREIPLPEQFSIAVE